MKNKLSNTQIVAIAIGVIAIIIAIVLIVSTKNPAPETKSEQGILFYSDTCPHCKNVEKFIDENNVKAKVDFVSKEVSTNEDNGLDLMSKGQKCKLAEQNIGAVPLYWDNGTCTVGDAPIIELLKSKIQ
jgi:glutaredoxin